LVPELSNCPLYSLNNEFAAQSHPSPFMARHVASNTCEMSLLPLAPSFKRWPGSHVVSSLSETGETGEMNWMKHTGERELGRPGCQWLFLLGRDDVRDRERKWG